MERLTKKNWQNLDAWESCGQDSYCRRTCTEPGGCAKGCIVPKMYSRLAEYEDTGLEPEICAEYKKFEDEIVASGKTFNRLIELLRAEKEGRLAVLPSADTSSVVQCRTCEYSCTAGGLRFCTFGVCRERSVLDTFFCADGLYKTNTGGKKA